jgi:glycosyltransferase involved in cell wall biosynthesis
MKIMLVKAFSKLTSVGLLARELKKRGHEVHILAPHEHIDCENMRRFGIPVHVINFIPSRTNRVARFFEFTSIEWRLIRLFRSENYDVIHLNLWRARFYGRIASIFAGRKRVWLSSIRGLEARTEKASNWLDDATVAVSATVKDFLVSEGLPASKVEVIHNGVDLEAMDSVPADPHYLHRELGLDKQVRLIGMVAYFRSYLSKGHKFFFDSMPLILEEFPDVQFVAAGSNLYPVGYTIEYFEAFAKEVGIRDKIHFLGERTDVPAVMSSLTINVLPSLKEGCPMVILEAMARGIPNVASRIESISEIITHEKNGILFEPGNPEALAGAVSRLLKDPATAKSLGQSGRKRLQEGPYRANVMGARYEALYLKLATQKALGWSKTLTLPTRDADAYLP